MTNTEELCPLCPLQFYQFMQDSEFFLKPYLYTGYIYSPSLQLRLIFIQNLVAKPKNSEWRSLTLRQFISSQLWDILGPDLRLLEILQRVLILVWKSLQGNWAACRRMSWLEGKHNRQHTVFPYFILFYKYSIKIEFFLNIIKCQPFSCISVFPLWQCPATTRLVFPSIFEEIVSVIKILQKTDQHFYYKTAGKACVDLTFLSQAFLNA